MKITVLWMANSTFLEICFQKSAKTQVFELEIHLNIRHFVCLKISNGKLNKLIMLTQITSGQQRIRMILLKLQILKTLERLSKFKILSILKFKVNFTKRY